MPPHDHDFHEIVMIEGGKGMHQTFYGERQLNTGDVLIIRPGLWHAYHHCRSLVVWNCCIAWAVLRHELRWAGNDAKLGLVLGGDPAMAMSKRGIIEFKLTDKELSAAVDLLPAFEQRQTLAGRLGQLLLVLEKLSSCAAAQRLARQQCSPTHPAVNRAIRLLSEDCTRPWTLDDLAHHVRLNRSYLVRRFKQQVGMSPIAFLNQRRGEAAAGLLMRTDLPIGEIGRRVGWDDPNYMARRFRQQFRCTPTALRQSADVSSCR